MGYDGGFCRNPLLSYLPNQLCDRKACNKRGKSRAEMACVPLAHIWGSMAKMVQLLIRETELLHVQDQPLMSSECTTELAKLNYQGA